LALSPKYLFIDKDSFSELMCQRLTVCCFSCCLAVAGYFRVLLSYIEPLYHRHRVHCLRCQALSWHRCLAGRKMEARAFM